MVQRQLLALSIGQRATLRLVDPLIQFSVVDRCKLIRVEPDGRPLYEAGLHFDASPGVRPMLAGLIATLARDRGLAPAAMAYY